ncbi:MAG: aldose 1-epimerase family protein [Oscillospiraceae bacterium]|nr:aldose 1-epimerase family protein [Oscillospiraceae bacterium]
MEKKITAGDSSAVISTFGAELKSLILNGRELMWSGDPKYWKKTSPVLFPAVGGLRDGCTLIDGDKYALPKHGFARDNEFECTSEIGSSLIFTLSDNTETLKMFPFRFNLSLCYTLTENSLEIVYQVENKSDVLMPFCIGAHPAFACPAEGWSFDDYRLVFQEKETVCSPVLDARTRLFKKEVGVWRLKNSSEYPLSYPLFDNDVLYFRGIASKSVALLNNADSGVRLTWEGFSSLGVWTPAGMNAPFVCIEPWCGCDDFEDGSGDFRDKPEVQTCLPGGSKYYVLTIESV